MEGENRTPDQPIGEIVQAQEQAKRTTGHLPPHGPGALREDVNGKSEPKAGSEKER
jgi:hypothetical protein